MILFDGKKLSERILSEIRQDVRTMGRALRLGIVVVGNDPRTQQFVGRKKKVGEQIGIDVRIYPFLESVAANELRAQVVEIVREEHNTGVIVQLPISPHLNAQHIANAVMPGKDVDVLSARAVGDFAVGKSKVLPPVVGALAAYFSEYKIEYKTARIVLVGAGTLVGKPIAMWLMNEGASFSLVRSTTKNPEEIIGNADIVITGVGKSNTITGDMVKDGAVVVDFGTVTRDGKIGGDVDFDSVSKKASHITPVPGGMGPMVVAMLFKNLVALANLKRR